MDVLGLVYRGKHRRRFQRFVSQLTVSRSAWMVGHRQQFIWTLGKHAEDQRWGTPGAARWAHEALSHKLRPLPRVVRVSAGRRSGRHSTPAPVRTLECERQCLRRGVHTLRVSVFFPLLGRLHCRSSACVQSILALPTIHLPVNSMNRWSRPLRSRSRELVGCCTQPMMTLPGARSISNRISSKSNAPWEHYGRVDIANYPYR